MRGKKDGKIGIIVGGGPAPGINGVISAAVIEARLQGLPVVGISGGFKALFDGRKNSAVPLAIEDVSRIHNLGGSILRTSREYPEKVKERFRVLMSTLRRMGINRLVTIGGEGTLFMANWIEMESRGSISVVHVPKTIDNDIPLPGGASTFGYQTARHWGVEIVENIMEDARTSGRWYFITTMGRHTGHLALGIGKASGATISLIPEEFAEEKLSFKKVADVLTCSIIKRLSMGKDHGVAILAEGISEKFELEELRHHEELEKDETGRVRLSEIQLGRIMKNYVKETLESFGIRLTIVDKNIGYELRAANPIPFDVEYARNLGYGAVDYLIRGCTGAMITVYEGRLIPVPFVETIDRGTGMVNVRYVDTSSEIYTVGRKYMIRLEEDDFSARKLRKLAGTANLSAAAFRKRFGYLAG